MKYYDASRVTKRAYPEEGRHSQVRNDVACQRLRYARNDHIACVRRVDLSAVREVDCQWLNCDLHVRHGDTFLDKDGRGTRVCDAVEWIDGNAEGFACMLCEMSRLLDEMPTMRNVRRDYRDVVVYRIR